MGSGGGRAGVAAHEDQGLLCLAEHGRGLCLRGSGAAGQRPEAGHQRREAGPAGRWDGPPLGCPAKAQLGSPSPTLGPVSPLGSLPVTWLLCGILARRLIAADRGTCSKETSGTRELGWGTAHSDLLPSVPSFLSCFLPTLPPPPATGLGDQRRKTCQVLSPLLSLPWKPGVPFSLTEATFRVLQLLLGITMTLWRGAERADGPQASLNRQSTLHSRGGF